jgi:hypothetical protein
MKSALVLKASVPVFFPFWFQIFVSSRLPGTRLVVCYYSSPASLGTSQS